MEQYCVSQCCKPTQILVRDKLVKFGSGQFERPGYHETKGERKVLRMLDRIDPSYQQ